MARIKKTVEASLWDLDGQSLDGLVEWAKNIRDAVPVKYRNIVKVECESFGGGGLTLEVSYMYDQTASEVAASEREERERVARFHAEKYAAERAEYERLKSKFEK